MTESIKNPTPIADARDLPTTNRPESVEDLPSYLTRSDTAITFRSWGDLAMNPEVLAAVSGVMTAVEANLDLWEVDRSGEEIQIGLRKSSEQLAKILDDQQRSYDRGREDYAKWLDTGELPSYRWVLDSYLGHIGIDPKTVVAREPEPEMDLGAEDAKVDES
ncbi:hypothetical protein SEA_LILBEANIE_46 [Gordonia phage Lilbeanie]|uniref:Uncharacterized protein n=1 Tax=Gordonia phage Lilbeanie TaxID=2794947 RepID=A0A7T1KSA0_9CAUD|nr:hypothetical protein J1773_gp46 [Gordonia phage Lilbeanie]QPO17124.1 hypothetical protein SEA_LILBEANIE_46 [Gordonia phage Lilbeanie]